MNKPSKARVRQSFERAAPTYDSAASVQRLICAQLAAGLPPGQPMRILDAGCGTGHAQSLLQQRFPAAQALTLDLAPAMLQRVAGNSTRIAGDLEHLPLAGGCIDLYWSSLAVQWCDLATALREARRTLIDGGQLALASLGPETFRELRLAFAGVDNYQHTLSFHTLAEVRQIAEANGLVMVNTENSVKFAHYADFKSLLRAVKAVGANQLGDGRRTTLMSRRDFARAEQLMETLRTPAGLPLSYDVIYLYARK